jgi:hypothetical protein
VTLMSLPVGGEIRLEAHPETDQFLRLDAGSGCRSRQGRCASGQVSAAKKSARQSRPTQLTGKNEVMSAF